MSSLSLDAHWQPPRTDRVGPGAALSLLAHAGLVGALAAGLHWRNSAPPSVMSAELWSSVPQVAAPAAAPAPPPPPPPPPEAAKPDVRTTPPPAPNAQRDADIATERAAKIRQAEQAARDAAQLIAQKAALKAAQQAAQQAAHSQAQVAAQKLADERQAKAKVDAAKAAQVAQAEAVQLAKQRDENLKRMLAQAGSESTNSAGTANRDMAPSADLAGRIRAKVKANIIDTSAIQGNPVAEVEVRCSPDGTITSRRISKPSGNATWDDTVLRALDKTRSLPREADGRIPAAMILVFSARE